MDIKVYPLTRLFQGEQADFKHLIGDYDQFDPGWKHALASALITPGTQDHYLQMLPSFMNDDNEDIQALASDRIKALMECAPAATSSVLWGIYEKSPKEDVKNTALLFASQLMPYGKDKLKQVLKHAPELSSVPTDDAELCLQLIENSIEHTHDESEKILCSMAQQLDFSENVITKSRLSKKMRFLSGNEEQAAIEKLSSIEKELDISNSYLRTLKNIAKQDSNLAADLLTHLTSQNMIAHYHRYVEGCLSKNFVEQQPEAAAMIIQNFVGQQTLGTLADSGFRSEDDFCLPFVLHEFGNAANYLGENYPELCKEMYDTLGSKCFDLKHKEAVDKAFQVNNFELSVQDTARLPTVEI